MRIFESPAGYPTEFLHSATNIVMMKARDSQARCHFLDISPGTYALAVIHDENVDGKFATKLSGDPYGRLWLFKRRKSYDECAFVRGS